MIESVSPKKRLTATYALNYIVAPFCYGLLLLSFLAIIWHLICMGIFLEDDALRHLAPIVFWFVVMVVSSSLLGRVASLLADTRRMLEEAQTEAAHWEGKFRLFTQPRLEAAIEGKDFELIYPSLDGEMINSSEKGNKYTA